MVIAMHETLRKLQLEELEILKRFVRICDKHGLRYYLVGGTLLGAVRHRGFIPWDDDIDVAMMRSDYECFAEICQKELGAEYFYQSPETDPYYFLTYAKIRKNGTLAYEERFRNSKFNKGVFIDIIPLDHSPGPSLICHLLFNVLAIMNYRGQIDSGETYHPYQELLGKIGYICLSLWGKRQLVDLRVKIIGLSKRLSKNRFLASYSGAYGYYKEIFPMSWFGEGSTVTFEGGKYKAPAAAVAVLSQIYGEDFLKIPPDSIMKGHIDIKRSRF